MNPLFLESLCPWGWHLQGHPTLGKQWFYLQTLDSGQGMSLGLLTGGVSSGGKTVLGILVTPESLESHSTAHCEQRKMNESQTVRKATTTKSLLSLSRPNQCGLTHISNLLSLDILYYRTQKNLILNIFS